ncbi:metal ABC transporter substrate-binding protein [Clostridium polynesiense]|uniref:metal ABC transporter substrate-binding protein n=1 Tax=Clostridium polynesiense TaxID=1325933 RepID=UPI00058CDC18|nr:zinc ABC transporter substrate-binding protein [Clostridium polynesiense]
MSKKILAVLFAPIFALALSGCDKLSNKKTEENKDKINVVVSIYPLKEFTEAVGGDKVKVTSLVPEGVEPHDFEPKPKDMEILTKSHLFVINGLGMEEWLDKVYETVSSNKDINMINTSKGADIISLKDNDLQDDKDDHGEDEHEELEYDPHIWLSLKEAKVQSKNIKDALIAIDGENKDYYENNYNVFSGKLDDLYKEYKAKFEGVGNKNFVTGHWAFGYLCRDFNLTQKGISGLKAEGEPTPQKMKSLVEYAKANNIKVIFNEKLASPKVSETLAKEVGARVEKIYTVESHEDNKGYLEMMKENLEKIYTSLK